jgi:hypothetical protein
MTYLARNTKYYSREAEKFGLLYRETSGIQRNSLKLLLSEFPLPPPSALLYDCQPFLACPEAKVRIKKNRAIQSPPFPSQLAMASSPS